jgi:hypothetical protein
MGMYSIMTENHLIIIKPELVPEWLNALLEWESIKFYGYWTKERLEEYNQLGTNKIIEGYIIIRYEEGDIIKCIWNEQGFKYQFGKITFEDGA